MIRVNVSELEYTSGGWYPNTPPNLDKGLYTYAKITHWRHTPLTVQGLSESTRRWPVDCVSEVAERGGPHLLL